MDNVEKLLREQMNDEFSTIDKVKAFSYHVGMVLFGSILCPEKHKEYMKVFDEFVKIRNEK